MDNMSVVSVAVNLLILSVVIFAIAKLLPAIKIKSFATAVVVAVIYSVINILLELLLKHASLPSMVKEAFVIGLIRVLVNALLLWVTEKLLKDFKIKGFGWTLVASLLITITCALITYFFPVGKLI
jgi:putative membrane protein